MFISSCTDYYYNNHKYIITRVPVFMLLEYPLRILRWYLSSMNALVPDWLRAVCLGVPMAKVLHFVEEGMEADRLSFAAAALKGEQCLPRAKQQKIVDVVLPEDFFLKRTVTMPRKARGRMQAVAQLDLLQKTPFRDHEIMWISAAVTPAGNQIHVQQIIALNSDIAAWRAVLAAANYPLRRIYTDVDGQRLCIADFTGQLAPRAGLLRGGNALATGAICAFLGSIWILPGYRAHQQAQSYAVENARLQTQLLDLRREVDTALSARAQDADFVKRLLHAPRLSDTLLAVTEALPDDVWIDRLIFEPDGVRFFGETDGSAVDLAIALAADGRLPNLFLSGEVFQTDAGAEEFWMVHDPLVQP